MKTVWLLALLLASIVLLHPSRSVHGADVDDDDDDTAATGSDLPKIKSKLGSDTTTSTDTETVKREEEAIKLDGLSVAETKQLRERAEKFEFQAEVNRMMKLIINSLYKNKEIFLRELISNASDALDKIRFISLTNPEALGTAKDLTIKIHVDKDNKVLHITDSGVGMTKAELIKNLGTIAKSGTSEFLSKLQEGAGDTSNLIGQFGVGFYSSFLVADTVVVTSKSNDDKQHIWTSDASSFTIVEDPRPEEQLVRGTRVSLYLKDEAQDYLETETIKNLIKKYSEFINFDIYLYTAKTVEVEEEEEEEEKKPEEKKEDAEVEVDEEKPKEKKKVSKTVWDWEIINANKPIWTRKMKDITEEEYNNFYKAFSKDSKDPLEYIHFTAEGEVTFRSILYIPAEAPANFFQEYGAKNQNIKMYVRRVFITDEFEDMMPKYLSFIRGVVDSDDLPLNVSRETLQQHKLLKVIKKKLVRKALEMIKKLEPEDYKKFWKEFGTAIKLGLIEDYSNRTRLAKLLRFHSSNSKDEMTSLEGYVERMKKDQASIYFGAGQTREEAERSPFVERLLKRGFEVLYLTEPVDEYTVQNLPEFEGKKFQNVAKEGLKFGDETEEEKKHFEDLQTEFEPLTKWFGEKLATEIEKAVVSTRLSESPCALVASQYAWDANMERIMKAQAYAKADDSSSSFYATQKKTLEINPRHPLIKKLLTRVKSDSDEDSHKATLDLAQVLVDTARLRSGYTMDNSAAFASRIETMLRLGLGVSLDEKVEPEPEFKRDAPAASEEEEEDVEADTKAKTDAKSSDSTTTTPATTTKTTEGETATPAPTPAPAAKEDL